MNAAVDVSASPASARAPRAQLDAVLERPLRCALDGDLGVIAVHGADAIAFLQSQLTNDSQALDDVSVQLNGYCTAKGRLLAVFDQWRTGGADVEVLLQLPREILPGIIKRLSMFVLRAKARLADASDEWHTAAVLGKGSAAWVHGAFGRSPTVGQTVEVDGMRITRAREGSAGIERFVVRARGNASDAMRGALASLAAADAGVWWWSQIDAGVPTVVAATQEAFVPQMINLEVLGGVNFKKGCYPGQEVVARSQYLGKLRRRMSIGHCGDESPHAAAGGDVFVGGRAEPAGKIVAAATAPGGGIDLLFECPVDRLDIGSVRLAGDVQVHVRALPYELFDVTA